MKAVRLPAHQLPPHACGAALLVLDTSGNASHLGVCTRDGRAWVGVCPGSAGTSAALLPALQALMHAAGLTWAELDAVGYGQGPGSFTGVRTAVAVAQGLAFAHGAPVVAINTLQAVALQAVLDAPQLAHSLADDVTVDVTVAMDARMGEIYTDHFKINSKPVPVHAGLVPISPLNFELPPGAVLAGNAHLVYPAVAAGAQHVVQSEPGGLALLHLAAAGVALGLQRAASDAAPEYGRNKVAQTTAEREAQKPFETPNAPVPA
jgi:tRNA threonylcarbamoyladenosine biosynthesis protein TsaB